MKDSFYLRYLDRESNKEMKWPLEDIVCMLLALEMDIGFHIEALKAQAVIIRTNLLRNSSFLKDHDIRALVEYKDIWGIQYEDNLEKIKEAVDKTKDIVVLFKGKLIDAKYHILCGGSTENAEDVMDNHVTYLRRVLCTYCAKGPYWDKQKEFNIDELEELLDIRFPHLDKSCSMEIANFIDDIEKDDYGRVRSMRIGGKSFTAEEILRLLDLNSNRFNIYPTGIRFTSSGMGHGLGLCQWGANMMAQEGFDFIEILKYYYTGVSIERIELPCIKRPLLGKIIVIDPGHGGEDAGHQGDGLGLLEKDIAFRMSVRLKEELEQLGALIYLTRESDMMVSINERIRMANKVYPDFFISLHMDYFPRSNIQGLEMYYFRKDMESQQLGRFIKEELREEGVILRGLKEGNFYIFRAINVSSILIELGYLSSLQEEIKFNSENYIKTLINGIRRGIVAYFNH